MTKADYDKFCDGLHHLALDIGIRPAARAMGIGEERAKKIAQRRNWRIRQHKPIIPWRDRAAERLNGEQRVVGSIQSPSIPVSPIGISSIEVKQRLLELYGDRAKLAAANCSAKVFEHLTEQPPGVLVSPATAISADQWSKVADRTLGWTQARAQAQGVTVNIANILPPTAEEDAERRKRHASLDELTRLLTEKSV